MRIKFQRVFEGGDRLRKLFELSVGRSEEVPGVRVALVDFSYAAEGVNSGARVRRILVIEAKVVPSVRIFGITLGSFFEQRLCFIAALQVEQRHSAIHESDIELRI